MGIDACGYFVTKRPLSDEEIARILEDFNATYYGDFKISFSSLRAREDFTPACVSIDFDLDRLYEKGYARGNFVKHATVCGWLMRRPYVVAVYYGGDCVDLVDISEWTKEREHELLDLYLNSNQLTYRDADNKRDWFGG